MKNIDLMIFDLDGTLANTGKDLAAAVNHALGRLGLPELQEGLIISYVGDGVETLIKRALGQAAQERHGAALEIFLAYYGEHLLEETRLYPGVAECLNHFAAKRKILISNKRQDLTLRIVEGLGIARYFEDIVGGDTYPYKKPDARMATPYLARYNVKGERAVIIGDGPNDILLARNAGMVGCAFLNGLVARERLLALKPDYTCDDLRELAGLFC